MTDPSYTWLRIDEALEKMPPGDTSPPIMILELGVRKICVTLFEGQYYGFAFLCPHNGASMAEGRIDERGNVACPVHKYKFSIRNGRNVTGEGYFLKTYPIERREDGIFVRL